MGDAIGRKLRLQANGAAYRWNWGLPGEIRGETLMGAHAAA
jgi:hypothetical protein